jgi:aminoglycoside phosphotransferase (APT) family kinase protein
VTPPHRPADRGPVDAADAPVLRRTLVAAGLSATGRFTAGAGWVSRVWVGDELVVRTSEGRFRDAYRHEAQVLQLLAGSEVPHARVLALGEGPDGPWCVSERLPGRTLHAAWPEADAGERRSIVQSLGTALRALHQIEVGGEVGGEVGAELRPP